MVAPHLHYKITDNFSKPVLMIVHGLFGSLDNWQSLAKKWSESFRVISVDVRNHGRSFHSDDMKFESLVNDLYSIIGHENVKKLHLLGHSMGGKIAMEFAAIYPDIIDRLIIVDVAPYPYPPHHTEVFDMLQAIDLSSLSSRVEIEKEVRNRIDNESVIQFMMKNIRRNEISLTFEWKFNLSVLSRDYLYLIQRLPSQGFNGHTLFIGGEESKYITKETSLYLFDLYPKAVLEYVANAGHWVHADNPSEFYDKVTSFINQDQNKNVSI
jgi:pimeloyl-ACP methyl ester carboxylesterase